jgi:hypothetical protein
MSVASLLILMGGSGKTDTRLLVAGSVLAVAGLGAALYLALGRWPGRPRPPEVRWAIGGVVLFYALMALAAATAGPAYGFAGLAAGVFPITALALLVATTRAKTAASPEGRLRDASAEADEDPYPGIGLDADTPLGDTPEHSGEQGHERAAGASSRRPSSA